jgi:hypothetical protein
VARLTTAALDAYRIASTARLLMWRREHALPPPSSHVTAVARVPLARAMEIAATIESLRELAPTHYFYPADTLHLTVQNLDDLGPDAVALARDLLEATPPFELDLRGLNVSGHSVFVQALPLDGTLRDLRRRFDTRRVAVSFGHMNVVRFKGRVGRGLLAAVARRRALPLGRLAVEEVEIVETDRLLSSTATRVVERVALRVPVW